MPLKVHLNIAQCTCWGPNPDGTALRLCTPRTKCAVVVLLINTVHVQVRFGYPSLSFNMEAVGGALGMVGLERQAFLRT